MKNVIVMFCLSMIAICIAQQSEIGDRKKEIMQEIEKIEKTNPHVYFRDVDNPAVNVSKKMKSTYINKKFWCPYHKGFAYDEHGGCGYIAANRYSSYGHAVIVCKGGGSFAKWMALKNQIDITSDLDSQINELKDELKSFDKQKISNTSSKSTITSISSNAEKKTIRIRKSTVMKLLEDGIVENDRLTIILVED